MKLFRMLPLAIFLGLLWLCLWKGPLRWLGLPLALAVNLAPKPVTPDVWVSGDFLPRRRKVLTISGVIGKVSCCGSRNLGSCLFVAGGPKASRFCRSFPMAVLQHD